MRTKSRGTATKSKRKVQLDGPFKVLEIPEIKLERRLNELARDGLDLVSILSQDSATFRVLMKAKPDRKSEGELIREVVRR